MKAFRYIHLPDKRKKLVPDDVPLHFPIRESDPQIALKLVEIPWEEAYGQHIPEELRDYWNIAFKYLHVRTTDVHTAICLTIMDEFLRGFDQGFYDPLVVGVGLIFHDAGWSTLSDAEVAASLGVTGLVLSKGAMGPKEAHLEEGKKIVEEELRHFGDLTNIQKQTIIEIVAFHD